MLTIGVDYKPEPYSAYKNRVFSKHIDKLNNQLMQIKNSSLKADDKTKLKAKLLQQFN